MKISNERYLSGLLWGLRVLPGVSPAELVRRHGDLFGRYVDTDALCSLLGPEEPCSAVVRRAFELSAAELEGGGEAAGRMYSLKSVFSRLSAGEADRCPPVYYQPRPLTAADIFPDGTCRELDSSAADALERELTALTACPPQDAAGFIVIMDMLLRRCLWAVPASRGMDVDISLYDRLRVTAAVAFCLETAAPGGKEPFLLLTGDFSGIQSYIFAVASTNIKGVAKRLRARSFLVDTMVQTLAYRACDQMGVPYGNILMLTDGKFYLLLPNTPETAEKVEALCREAEESLFQRFSGEIAVNLAGVTFGEEGLLNYSAVVVELLRRLREQKQRPFHSVLTDENGWREDRFILTEDLAGKRSCPSCGRALMDRELEVCLHCREQERLGAALAGAKRIWYSRKGGEYRLWDDFWLSFSRERAEGELIRVEQLNDWELTPPMTGYPLSVRLIANHLPRRGGEPMTFEDIAGIADGSDRLAVLKADVDNLGFLFADGMREQGRHYGTISRTASLSRGLEVFFSGYVGHLLDTDPDYQAVYCVFSGGDDLFLIGPWDVMPKLALRLEEDFRHYAGGNPCVTLSAAICAADPKTNIALLADRAEEELKQVKNAVPQGVYPGRGGRNAVSFLGDVFSWEDLAAQMANLAELRPAAGFVGTAVLRRIVTYSGMYRRFLLDHDVMGLMFEPLMHYDQVRNYAKLSPRDAEAFLRYARGLPKNAANYNEINKDLYFAKTVVTCLLDMTKEVRNHGV